MIVIVDYGMGNLKSISNMLKKLGHDAIITNQIDEIKKASRLLLPGVGAFDMAMKNIKSLGFFEVLDKKVTIEKTPILGICLGMQLLTNGSEEGNETGFGWINADTIRFNSSSKKVPHMGWNSIKIEKKTPIFEPVNKERRFYFVHSYYVQCKNQENILATTEYGDNFASMIHHENLYGVQFHPEKSHKYGMEILNQFAKI